MSGNGAGYHRAILESGVGRTNLDSTFAPNVGGEADMVDARIRRCLPRGEGVAVVLLLR